MAKLFDYFNVNGYRFKRSHRNDNLNWYIDLLNDHFINKQECITTSTIRQRGYAEYPFEHLFSVSDDKFTMTVTIRTNGNGLSWISIVYYSLNSFKLEILQF